MCHTGAEARASLPRRPCGRCTVDGAKLRGTRGGLGGEPTKVPSIHRLLNHASCAHGGTGTARNGARAPTAPGRHGAVDGAHCSNALSRSCLQSCRTSLATRLRSNDDFSGSGCRALTTAARRTLPPARPCRGRTVNRADLQTVTVTACRCCEAATSVVGL